MLTFEWFLAFILLGGLVGFISGLLGVGGGGILVPLLASIFTLQGIGTDDAIPLSLGTALACMIFSSAAAIRAHAARGAVEWHIAMRMALTIIVGAFGSSLVASLIDPLYLAIFFSVFMAIVALQMFMNWQPQTSQKPVTTLGLSLAGSIIGFVSALAAVGGGFMSIVYLNYKGIDTKKAIGTSAAIGFSIAIAGTLGYLINGWSVTPNTPYAYGYVYLPAFILITISSVTIAPLGARLSHILPNSVLKKLLAIISIMLSVRMIYAVI